MLRTLGRLQLEASDFRRPQPLVLLAYLSLEGAKERHFLADVFWMHAADPLNRLSSTLSRLREQAPGVVGADATHVWSNVETDAQRFVHSVHMGETSSALDLYNGPFLAGVRLELGVELEEWMYGTRESFARLAARTALGLAEGFAGEGEYLDAVRYAEFAYRTAASAELELADMERLYTLLEAGRSPYAESVRKEMDAYDVVLPKSVEQARSLLADRFGATPSRSSPHTLVGTPGSVDPEEAVPGLPAGTSFVGRTVELAWLDGHAEALATGRHRTVLIGGEPGQGKTSLLHAFARRAEERVPTLILASASGNAYTGTADPYLPFREIFEQLTGDVDARIAAGLLSREHAVRLWRLMPTIVEAVLEEGPDLIGTLLEPASLSRRASAHGDAGDPWRSRLQAHVDRALHGPNPGVPQGSLFNQVARVLRRIAGHSAIVLLLDDLQWVDAGSIDLILHLMHSLQGFPVLLAGAIRSDDLRGGGGGERATLSGLVPAIQREQGDVFLDLDARQDAAFVDALLDAEPNRFEDAFRGALRQRTAGHPLYAAELFQGLKERGEVYRDATGHWTARSDLDWHTVPARLEGAIVDRLSRLGEDLRELLQVASVQGEEFSAEVVARVLELPVRETVRSFHRELAGRHGMIASLGVRRHGGRRSTRFRFRHNLIQEYLYASMDVIERTDHHERTAVELAVVHEERLDEAAVELARHYELAGLHSNALDSLTRAARYAMHRSAYHEALTHLKKGFGLLRHVYATADHDDRELDLLSLYAPALIATHGWSLPEAERAYRRALELSGPLDRPSHRTAALYGLATMYELRGEYERTQEVLRERDALAHAGDRGAAFVESYELLACSKFHQGAFEDSLRYADQVWDEYDPRKHLGLTAFLGENPGVSSRQWGALSLWFLGYPDRALARIEDAHRLASRMDHTFSLAHATEQAAILHHLRREPSRVLEYARRTVELAEEHGYPYRVGTGTILVGWSLAAEGHAQHGIAQLREGLRICASTGARIDEPYFLALLAEACLAAGRIAEGLDAVNEALGLVQASRSFFYEAELHRLRGLLVLSSTSPTKRRDAEASFRLALNTAREQRSIPLQLRAALALARLEDPVGEGDPCRKAVLDIVEGITEGLESPDVLEARTFLRTTVR